MSLAIPKLTGQGGLPAAIERRQYGWALGGKQAAGATVPLWTQGLVLGLLSWKLHRDTAWKRTKREDMNRGSFYKGKVLANIYWALVSQQWAT